MELITKVYGDGVSVNIDVLSLPQTYRDLRITGYVDSSSTTRRLLINAFSVNGDSLYMAGGTTFASGTTANAVRLNGFEGTSTAAANIQLELPGYTNTTINKNAVYRAQVNGGSGGVYLWGGVWAVTAAITDLRFNSTAAWSTNTYFEIWGL